MVDLYVGEKNSALFIPHYMEYYLFVHIVIVLYTFHQKNECRLLKDTKNMGKNFNFVINRCF